MESRNNRICLAQPWAQLTLCLVMLTTTTVIGFQPTSGLQQRMGGRTTRPMAALDPNDLVNWVHQHPTLDSILSTLYAIPADVSLKPAHGHSQPFFGPPDPLLQEIKSIAPNLKALGIDLPTVPSDQWPEAAKAAFEKGEKIIDASKFEAGGGRALPGFTPIGGILPRHDTVPEVGIDDWPKQAQFIGKYYQALQKMIVAVFAYAVLDFGFLRNDVDVYKEDIEEEPLEVAAETMAVAGVRLGVFFLIGLVTLVIFG